MKSKKLSYNKILVLFCIILVSVLMTGCNGDDEPIVLLFFANPSTINQGESSTLTWSVSDATTITITPGVGTVASSGSTSVSPVVTTTYTLIATNSAGSVTATCTVTVNPAAVAVGDSYGGGIVAYILQSGDPGYDANVQHGLIAATSDQGSAEWSYSCTNLGTETGIGTGQSNTTAIVLWLNIHGEKGRAAQLCDHYSITVDDVTYSDWFLPSIDELNKLYINRVAIGGFPGQQYWSSSERGAFYIYAWLWDFYLGVKLYTLKYLVILPVRAVRAF